MEIDVWSGTAGMFIIILYLNEVWMEIDLWSGLRYGLENRGYIKLYINEAWMVIQEWS